MPMIALDIQPNLRHVGYKVKYPQPNVVGLKYPMPLNNEQLAALIKTIAVEKNREAFSRLFEHYAPRLKAFSMKQGLTASKADEMVQEAMLQVWRKSESFDSERGSASNWIFTIMRNKRIDMFRRQRHPEYELDESMGIVDSTALPDEQVSRFQESERIREAVKSLPEAQMEIVRKAFFEDKSHGEIAEDLGIPLGTVKSRIRLAIARLRLSVEEGA